MSVDKFLEVFTSKDVEPLGLELTGDEGSLGEFIKDFGSTSESYFFYGGSEELRFDRPNWKWYRVDPDLGNLTELYGVTSTVKRADNPAALIPWAAKMMYEKLLRTIPTQTLSTGPDDLNPLIIVPSMTLAQFSAIALEAKSAHKEKFEDAGDVGHMAHACIESSIKKALLTSDKKVQELVDLPADPRACTCARSAKGWMDAHNVRWIETETKVYSKKYLYAGTMDGLCIVDSCSDPACCTTPFKDVLSVADWKSSNRLRTNYIFQVAGYKAARLEEYGGAIPDCWILRIGKEDEEFEPWHLVADDFEDDFAGFLACLELLQIVDKVEKRISERRHSISAVKKEQRAAEKALAKAAEKLQKATEKAEKKAKQLEEKARIKAEAKAERERLKAETTKVIVEALLNPPEPNDALKEAAKSYTDIVAEESPEEYTPSIVPTEENE